MAKAGINTAQQCAQMVKDIKEGKFAPVYLLMGDEPYYPEVVCNAILDNCIDESEKDFNETVCYGSDVTAEQVITAARRFPMMADRQLVVVREAQMMKSLEDLAIYCAEPLESTVLVILMYKASADKRKAFYKAAQKTGIVMDSPALRDYEIPSWIEDHMRSRGLNIDPEASRLFAEEAGTDLNTIKEETDKLIKSIPEGKDSISVEDVEKNVGTSRQFSIFELTRELSYKNHEKALAIASHIGNSAKFAMPMATSALYNHFNRILRYSTLCGRDRNPSAEDKARVLHGVNPYFYKEYDAAIRNYTQKSAMNVMALLCEYDYLGKGGDGGVTDQQELMIELTAKILNS